MRVARLSALIVSTALAVAVSGCGQGGGRSGAVDGDAASPAPAPSAHTRLAALDPATLPESTEQAETLVRGLPEGLADLKLDERGKSDARWSGEGGQSVAVTVQPLAQAATPDTAMTDFFPVFARTGGFDLEQEQLGTGPVLYFAGTDRNTGGKVAAWAASAGEYLFAVEASSPDLLDLGVAAMTGG